MTLGVALELFSSTYLSAGIGGAQNESMVPHVNALLTGLCRLGKTRLSTKFATYITLGECLQILVVVFQGSRMFGTPGMGGQNVYGDLEHKLGFAFLTNRLDGGVGAMTPPCQSLVEATYNIVKSLKQ